MQNCVNNLRLIIKKTMHLKDKVHCFYIYLLYFSGYFAGRVRVA